MESGRGLFCYFSAGRVKGRRNILAGTHSEKIISVLNFCIFRGKTSLCRVSDCKCGMTRIDLVFHLKGEQSVF